MTNFHVCWSIDCESCRPEVNDTTLGRKAIEGFCEIIEAAGWRSTLFLMPEEIESFPDLLARKAEAGHEIALHLHPDESGFPGGSLGVYSRDEQLEIVGKGLDAFERILGVRPVTARPGFGGANDATFPVMAELGIRQTSMSFPGRKMSGFASNWAGAPLFAHYAHPYNRFLTGGLDLVEIPFSVDWETMIWGGIHPQDLRVEFTDAKNHGFLIRKIMQRQVMDNLPLRALVPFTHNIFDYSDRSNFRRETMEGMIEEIVRNGESLDAELIGATLSEAAAAFRAFEGTHGAVGPVQG
jgi:peptidoglycan/xylan/chitin deacetylase (PgdA/CDA1 family)